MEKFEWELKNWESWAKIGIKILPYIKNKHTKGEVDGIIKIIRNKNYRTEIFDVCCGWGRHCLELANRGYQNVSGADSSKIFIEYAKNSDQMRKIRFIQEDVMKIDLKNKFDIALNLWHSIGLYKTEAQNLDFFKKIYTFLKPSGKLLVDSANGDRDLQRIKNFYKDDYIPGNRHWWYLEESNILGLVEADFEIKEKIIDYRIFVHKITKKFNLKKKNEWKLGNRTPDRVSVLYEDDYIPGNKHWLYNGNKKLVLSEIRRFIDKKKNIKYQVYKGLIYPSANPLSSEKVPLRIYTKTELTNLLRSAGFEICNIYGDFQMNEHLINSPRLIIVAKKRYYR